MTRTNANKAAWRGDDFPSWLSPMVVKELRQGGQSGAFAWTFIGLQGAMFLLMSWALVSFNSGGEWQAWQKDACTAVFWLLVGVAVVVIVPLRGLGAISGERAGNNLDLVRLTRLSATRIVLGKWLALIAQGGLLVTAILPYIVLRYFFGGVNVVRDLEAMGWLFAASVFVAAAALALSTQPLWIRIACGVVALSAVIPFEAWNTGRWLVTNGWRERLAALALMGLYAVVLLEYASARIAPAAENHAFRKRTLALAIASVWVVVGLWATDLAGWAVLTVTLPLVAVYAVEALLEQPVHLHSHAAAFARWGLPGRAAARLFTPGWASGLNFVILLMLICGAGFAALILRVAPIADRLLLLAFFSLAIATVLFPIPLVVSLPRVRHRLLLYGLVQLVCFLIFVYARAMKPHDVAWQDWTGGWMTMLPFPLAAFSSWLASPDELQRSPAFVIAAVVVTAVVLLAVARPWWREMRAIGRLLAGCRSRCPRTRARAGSAA